MSPLPASSEHQDYYEERRFERRITTIQIAFIVVLVVYVMVFWYLQIVRTDHYRTLSDNNRLRRARCVN